jgi:hypothetical protein
VCLAAVGSCGGRVAHRSEDVPNAGGELIYTVTFLVDVAVRDRTRRSWRDASVDLGRCGSSVPNVRDARYCVDDVRYRQWRLVGS